MKTAEQRRQVLDMLAEGKITAEEAERLLAALDNDPSDSGWQPTKSQRSRPKYLRVVVNSPDNFGGNGPGRVNVRVPLQLLRAGVRLASFIPPQALNHLDKELAKSGISMNLSQLKPEHIEELIDALNEVAVDVDQPEAKVQVFCE